MRLHSECSSKMVLHSESLLLNVIPKMVLHSESMLMIVMHTSVIKRFSKLDLLTGVQMVAWSAVLRVVGLDTECWVEIRCARNIARRDFASKSSNAIISCITYTERLCETKRSRQTPYQVARHTPLGGARLLIIDACTTCVCAASTP